MPKKQTNTDPKPRPRKPTPVGKAFDTVRRLERERDEAVKKAADNTRDRYAKRIAAAIDGCEDPDALNRMLQAMETGSADSEPNPPPDPAPDWLHEQPEPLHVQEVERG